MAAPSSPHLGYKQLCLYNRSVDVPLQYIATDNQEIWKIEKFQLNRTLKLNLEIWFCNLPE